MNIKIVCCSDTHGYDEFTVPKCDILIHSGDFMTTGNHTEEITAFSHWMMSQQAKHRICIPGNHDVLFETMPDEAVKFLDKSIHFLLDRSIKLEGLNFYGTPWTNLFCNWAFMKEDKDLVDVFRKIPKKTDILISHGPAYGVLDSSRMCSFTGSKALLERISIVKPKYHIFGHIHSAHGQIHIGDTEYCNCSVLADDYVSTFDPTILNINTELL